MMKDTNQRSDFKSTITPHLELLLHYSLWLTRNGLDATRLLREALIEASQLFDASPSEEHWNMRLREIMTRRYLYGNQEHADPLARNHADNVDDSLVRNNPLFPFATHSDQRQLWQTEGSDADVNYLNAMASLPAVCRSAMILSYLEGFSTREIADLAGVRPQAIESLLGRGRGFIREELFLHLFGNDPVDVSEERKAESA